MPIARPGSVCHACSWDGPATALLLLFGLGPAAAVPQIPRDSWKDCLYNDVVIPCRDVQEADQLRIDWIDGIRSRFQRRAPARPGLPSSWGDRYGGLWNRELLPQGNTVLTNPATGNRIVIPLRFPCKPPLRGEVGYCQEGGALRAPSAPGP